MNTFAKVLITVVLVLVFGIINTACLEGLKGQGGGVIAIACFAGLVGALKALWKNKKDDSDDNNNTAILQK